MSSVVIQGDTSGSVTLAAPATAGSVTVTLPATSGTMAVSGASQSFTDVAATGNLTVDGNTVLGNASTDTLNVGNGGLVKDASGNVGIGTSSPSAKLDVNKGSAGVLANFTDGVNTNCQISTTSLVATVGPTAGSTALAFQSSGSERMRIDSSGNLTVGSAVAATNRYININGVASKAGAIQFQESGATKWLVGNGAASENGVFQIYDNVNGTGVQLSRGATSWAAISDERLKDIIEPITGAANKVSTLRAVIGKYKTDKKEMRRSFLIAQDVQAVLPEAVDSTNTEQLEVRYTEVIPLLVAAIQEQQALITTLTDRITALENK